MTTPLEAVANHESLFANALDLLVDGIALLGRDGRIVYVNEALRTLAAREVRYFLPPDPTHRYGVFPKGKLVAQTEDVLVDTRGYIYITDKNQGLYILKYTGK